MNRDGFITAEVFARAIQFMEVNDRILTLKHIAIRGIAVDNPHFTAEQIQETLKWVGIEVSIASINSILRDL